MQGAHSKLIYSVSLAKHVVIPIPLILSCHTEF